MINENQNFLIISVVKNSSTWIKIEIKDLQNIIKNTNILEINVKNGGELTRSIRSLIDRFEVKVVVFNLFFESIFKLLDFFIKDKLIINKIILLPLFNEKRLVFNIFKRNILSLNQVFLLIVSDEDAQKILRLKIDNLNSLKFVTSKFCEWGFSNSLVLTKTRKLKHDLLFMNNHMYMFFHENNLFLSVNQVELEILDEIVKPQPNYKKIQSKFSEIPKDLYNSDIIDL